MSSRVSSIFLLPSSKFLWYSPTRCDKAVENHATLCPKVMACLAGAPMHQGGECKKEEDCGGTSQVPAFCEFEPKGPSIPGIFVNNQFGPEQVDAIKEKELCVPSTFVDGN
jgi:hypothetical protein